MAPAVSLSFRDQYQARIAAGEIEPDPAQARAVEAYAALDARLDGYKPGHKNGFLGRLFGDKKNGEAPQGLYVHGEVGRGKTMLMDLFFHASPVAHKRRAHFHEFMADVHERIYGFRQKIASGQLADADPVRLTAQTIFDDAWLLCFDEFHVTDIADAMILGRLFERLFALGTVVVATSNVAPEDLYKGGLNRALFLPFIAQIQQHMSVLRLDARTDFRLEKLAGAKMWLVPADAAADAALDAAFLKLTGGARGAPRDNMIKGVCCTCRAPRTASPASRSRSCASSRSPRPTTSARARLSHPGAGSRAGDGLRAAQRSQAFHHPDRHAL